ncbi:MAG: DUF262 domain-containing protein [Candidatus Woesearchaeota archaeon]|jgi:uncharacterized protein with ParB-like and HNH nuclease domain|nr:DUF262 domain-containing protein [Candidatus Woesearchaeota archaeon]
MKAVDVQFMDLIKQDIQFKTPIYQRVYDWRYEHCEALFKDIKSLLDNKNNQIHFMGSVVYITEKEQNASGTKEYLLIDGQQRITTFTLIFLLLENLVKEDKNIALSEKIRNTCLINQYSSLDNKSKLVLTRRDNTILQKLINSDSLEQEEKSSNLYNNYSFLKSKFYELSQIYSLQEIFDILSKLMIVDVSLKQGMDDPQQIFESLNATGKELTSGDLIRNFILMNLTNELQNRIYNNYWYPMEQILEDDLSDFIKDYLYMKKGVSTNIKDKELYDDFKNYFYKNYTHKEIEEVGLELLKYSRYYDIISEEKDENENVNKALKDLNSLEYDSYYPLLLRIFDEYKLNKLKSDDLIDIIKAIESFLFRRSICQVPTNSLNPIFRTMIGKLDFKELKNSLIDNLKEGEDNKRWPDNKEFSESLKFSKLYGTSAPLKILLIELEKYENKEANKDFSSLSIEHILPQTSGDPEKLSKNWKIMLGDNYKEIRNEWINKLGNLTLTGYNSELSSKDFVEKKKLFIESGLRLNKKVADYEAWNEDSIKDRADKLIKTTLKRWDFFE